MPPSLLDLPQELLDLILHYIWSGSPTLWLKHSSNPASPSSAAFTIAYPPSINPTYPSPSLNQHGLPLWLLTNRALLASGLAQLKRHATWSWISSLSTFDYDRIPGCANPLAGASAATNFTIRPIYSFRRGGADNNSPEYHPASALALRFSPTNLKVLSLNMAVRQCSADPYILYLRRFGNADLRLKELSVKVLFLVKLRGRTEGCEAAFAKFFAQAADEVEVMAREWIVGKRAARLEANAALPREMVERFDEVTFGSSKTTGRHYRYKMTFENGCGRDAGRR